MTGGPMINEPPVGSVAVWRYSDGSVLTAKREYNGWLLAGGSPAIPQSWGWMLWEPGTGEQLYPIAVFEEES